MAWKPGIPVIPFLLVNGEIYQGPRDMRSLESLVNLLRMEAMQFTECPPFSIDPAREYTAELETTRGRIVLQLLPARGAPGGKQLCFPRPPGLV